MGHQAFGLLLKDDVEEMLRLLKLLICPRVEHVGDVTEMVGGDRDIVSCLGEAQHVVNMVDASIWCQESRCIRPVVFARL